MKVDRRDFLKVLSAGAVTAAVPDTVFARAKKEVPPEGVGILYDATLCIGCKTCEMACQNYNKLSSQPSDSSNADFDPYTFALNKIQIYRNGNGTDKTGDDGYSFFKKACMHCVDPNCVSACPASALTKDEKTGIVSWNSAACIGCRYCQMACPYLIPKFEYNAAFPEIIKCEMCEHVQAKGKIPGCCDFCPTGATVFGKFSDILQEAKNRLTLPEKSNYNYPIADLSGKKSKNNPVKKYINYVYGEKEGGGTQYLILSAVPFENLGLPKLPDYSNASKTEGLQHTLYKGMIAPIVLFAGLAFTTYKTAKAEDKGE
ncbi:MAG: hydrogenase 2 operon protein HybA [Desulfobacula sp.]|nr:hydrogenase 2 operon protein HybA [Desulfobacula sp.]